MTRVKCSFCDGKGSMRSYPYSIFDSLENTSSGTLIGKPVGDPRPQDPYCPVCKGDGQIERPDESFNCPFCHGAGGFVKHQYKKLCHRCEGLGSIAGKATFLETELSSRLLPKISCYIVFIDILEYSKKISTTQHDIILRFNEIIDETLKNIKNQESLQLATRDIDLIKDAILLPLGDGIAIAFPFDVVENIHLLFAKQYLDILKRDDYYNSGIENFKVRIGLGKGDCLIYKDINGRYNIAGDEVNLTSRVMIKADPNGIVFTDHAGTYYKSLNSEADKELFEEKDVEIKHGVLINLHHYRNSFQKSDDPG